MQKQVKNNTDELFAQFAAYEISTEQASLVRGGETCRRTGYRVHNGTTHWDYEIVSTQEQICDELQESDGPGEDLDSLIGTTFIC